MADSSVLSYLLVFHRPSISARLHRSPTKGSPWPQRIPRAGTYRYTRMPPMSLHQVLEELDQAREYIAKDKIPEAIARLLPITRNQYHRPEREDEVIAISQRYHENYRFRDEETVTEQVFRVRSGKNVKKLLALIREIRADVQLALERDEAVAASPQTIAGEGQAGAAPTIIKERDLTQAPPLPQAPPAVILRVEQLKKSFRRSNFQLSVDALELRAGTLNVLVGENATGKSTLLRILAGELAADSGRLRYPFFSESARFSWSRLKNRLAYIPQFLAPWHQDLYRSLCYTGLQRGIARTQIRREVDFMVHRMGLAAYLPRPWRALSGGYKLRFALARALLWRPRLLLLDEPLAHLDVRAQLTVLSDLKKIITDRLYYLDTPGTGPNLPTHPLAILLCSQHIHEVEPLADQVFFMRAGQLERPQPVTASGPAHSSTQSDAMGPPR
ncbi:MAG: ATP-binding cassette domain-containing protein, partial [Bacteroidota bacterium]